MNSNEYSEFDGIGLAELVKKREVKPVELVEAAISRIERLNPLLNSVVYEGFSDARLQAERVPCGVFAGVPTLLKDLGGHKKGWPTRQGSSLTPDTPQETSSTVVERLEAAGCIPLGKTNVPEFGIMGITEPAFYGPARNPWDLNISPGGSSGGAGACVAAGIVPFAHAGDGGGSIRIPASCCGLVGLKPTRARVSSGPHVGDVMGGLVIDHVLTRTVRDCAAALDATAGMALGDPYCAPAQAAPFIDALKRGPRRLRIAFSHRNLYGGEASDECRAAVEHAAALCDELGHIVEEGSPPITPDYQTVRDRFEAIWVAGHALIIEEGAQASGSKPSPETLQGMVWSVYRDGINVSAFDYLRGWSTLHSVSRQVASWHEQYDMWLTPTMGARPWEVGHIDLSNTNRREAFGPMRSQFAFTGLQNLTGQPAISLPLYWAEETVPIGVQFAGRFGEEELLLALASQLEEAQPWIHRKPKVWA